MKSKGGLSIDTLNVSISDFYNFKSPLVNEFTTIELKAILLTYLNQLERVFLGTFGRTFSLEKDEEIVLFKEVFPFVSEIILKVEGDKGITKLCSSLKVFRNINAHGYVTCDFENELNLSPILKEFPNYSSSVRYVSNDGLPTIGGMIVLLLFMSNEKAVKYFIKNDVWKNFIEHLNFFGPDYEPDVAAFPTKVDELNYVRFETPIRKETKPLNIYKAIFGRFYSEVVNSGDRYQYINDEELEDASYNISLTINTNSNGNYAVTVQRGSVYNDYFRDSFQLIIIDLEDFIENCSKVPPFMFVVYLYKAGISEYTKDSLSKNNKELFEKLNKPKFYVDKNINSLFIPKSIMDLRLAGQIVSVNLNYCFLIFEYSLYKRKGLDVWVYSTFRNVLRFLSISEDMIGQMVAIRNFFAHYYILGDVKVVGSRGPTKIDIEFILKLYLEFASELKEKDWMIERDAINDLYYRLCCNLLIFKYASVVNKTFHFLYSPCDKVEAYHKVSIAMHRFHRSCINDNIERIIRQIGTGKKFIYYGKEITSFKKHTIISNEPITLLTGELLNNTISFIHYENIKPEEIFRFDDRSLTRTSISEYLEEYKWVLHYND